MNPRYVVALLAVGSACAGRNVADAGGLLSDMRAVRAFAVLEFGEEQDPAMARIVARGCSAYPALFSLVESEEVVPELVQDGTEHVRIGHVAVFAFSYLDPRGWHRALEDAVGKARFEHLGIYAYYELVETPQGRRAVRLALEKSVSCRENAK